MKTTLTIILMHFVALIQCQQTITISEDLPINTTSEYYRPNFTDKTLYFFADTLTWDCYQTNYNHTYLTEIAVTDFRLIDSCTCKKRTYISCKSDIFSKQDYRLIEEKVYGYLKRLDKNKYEYIEFDYTGKIKRKDIFEFNFSSIAKTNRLIQYDESTKKENIYIYNYFDVK